jgi:hypothetical protein
MAPGLFFSEHTLPSGPCHASRKTSRLANHCPGAPRTGPAFLFRMARVAPGLSLPAGLWLLFRARNALARRDKDLLRRASRALRPFT